MFVDKGKYSIPANMVINNSSNLIKIVTIFIVRQKTSYDVRKLIDNVFVANVHQTGSHRLNAPPSFG
jgi:hypothetical protein